MNSAVEKAIKAYGDGLGIDTETVTENMLISFLAHKAAREKALGRDELPEFMLRDGELLRGDELFQYLANYYASEMTAGPDQARGISVVHPEKDGPGGTAKWTE